MAKKRASNKSSLQKRSALSSDIPVSRRRYKRNFLKQVLARMDFALSIPELDKGPSKAIVAKLKRKFPISEPKKQVLQQMVFSTSAGLHQSKTETHQWIYHSKNRNSLINITGEFMYVEYKKYQSFDTLQKDFLTVANAIFDQFDGVQIKRLGLRYIDNLDFSRETSPTDWSKYLHQDLLASFNLADDPTTISRMFNVLEFAYGDMRMRFQYGMPNPDFPAAIRRKIFTLDYDAFCDQLLGREEIPGYLNRFHDKISASFEQVITDGLREKMGLMND